MVDYWVYAGVVVVIALAGIAAYLHWRLFLMRKLIHEQEQKSVLNEERKRRQINASIQILCRTVLDDQVRYAEASLRISALMNQLNVDEQARLDYAAFDDLAGKIAHIPILDAWKALPKEQRQVYEEEIQEHEAACGDSIRDAAQNLLGRELGGRSQN